MKEQLLNQILEKCNKNEQNKIDDEMKECKTYKECKSEQDLQEAFFAVNYIQEQKQKKNVIGPVKSGELEVPEGKDIEDLPDSHFKKLIKKDGWPAVSKRIIALKVWNKNKNPTLSKKMDALQSRLAKWVEKQRK